MGNASLFGGPRQKAVYQKRSQAMSKPLWIRELDRAAAANNYEILKVCGGLISYRVKGYLLREARSFKSSPLIHNGRKP